MGFLKKLFGGRKEKKYVDKTGIYFYAKCDNCGSIVRVRADKQHDLMREGGGYVWHKTIVDSRCFRRMQAVVYLDGNYQVSNSELQGGEFVTEAAYNEWLAAKEAAQAAESDAEASADNGEEADAAAAS